MNNVLLVVATGSVLLGTLYPLALVAKIVLAQVLFETLGG